MGPYGSKYGGLTRVGHRLFEEKVRPPSLKAYFRKMSEIWDLPQS